MHRSLISAQRIRVSGTVQGVGFRPTVWRLANDNNILGQVWNDAGGVVINAWGTTASLQQFTQQLLAESPPLARIDKIVQRALDDTLEPPQTFEIINSQTGKINTEIAADAATCPACLAEVLDPDNRRFRYPFTNCTHCGPRLSIVSAIPYDRKQTSMASFKMCPDCQAEYDSPADRRFHAQPNACSACGPNVWLEDTDGKPVALDNDNDAIDQSALLIEQGYIVAIKGLGGIHLCCDASNEKAVKRLRQRKHRFHKALALMARDIKMIRRYVNVTTEEAELLSQQAAPIVILNKQGEALASGLAPAQHTLGFMLPYTPLHHLLMLNMKHAVVMTSGNLSEEPQTISNREARQRLANIADYFLLHDRDIVNRLDDSVLQIVSGKARFLRRARGFAPQTIQLPEDFNHSGCVLAMGGELKNTFCLLKNGRAIVSQHIGDLENAATQDDYHDKLKLYQQLFDHQPEIIAVDMHQDYLSTQLGQSIAEQKSVPLVEVQHHHAHIASCMAESGIAMNNKVLGIVLDGLGLGEDGGLWGGEFMLADYQNFTRLAHFQKAPMLGGAQAMREPWRNTFAQLLSTLGWAHVSSQYTDIDIVQFLNKQALNTLQTMAKKGLNSPMTSSCGRLFDAVAAAIGLCREQAFYEGQAAIELESLAKNAFDTESGNFYAYDYISGDIGILKWDRLWKAILNDLQTGINPAIIAARFHHGLARAISQTAIHLCAENNVNTVVLNGGVFQNKLLLKGVIDELEANNICVLSPIQLPANDGGLALGQAAIAVSRQLLAGSQPGV